MLLRAKTLLIGIILVVGLGAAFVFLLQKTPAITGRDQLPLDAVRIVDRAYEMINQDELAAFSMFDNDPAFNHGDSYIFVLAADGTIVYHAADRTKIGENFANLRDADMRPFGLQLVTDAAPSGVWSSHRWHNPASGHTEWRLTYTRQTRQGHIVGAGIYAADSQSR